MYKKNGSNSKLCNKILEENGGAISDQARVLLLEDPELSALRDPLTFVSSNWRDPFIPSIVKLSCEATGSEACDIGGVSLALSLMHLSFSIWDDIIDRSTSKFFRPTLYGKYGEETALFIGGLASIKAFCVLEKYNLKDRNHSNVIDLVWRLYAIISTTEINSLKLRTERVYSSLDKLHKIESEAIATQLCLQIGATLGSGSDNEVHHLGLYGRYFGTILGLWNDFRVSTNLSLELAERLKNERLTYCLLLACERSKNFREKLANTIDQKSFDPQSIKIVVKDMLATGVLKEIKKNIGDCAQKAKEALEPLKVNRGTQTLQSLVELQPGFFLESISMLNS